MAKFALSFICLLLFGCATEQSNPEAVLKETNRVEGITFETGKSRDKVMDTIMEIVMDDGFDVDPITDAKQGIVCRPRFMLNGILMEKTEGEGWDIQSKRSTMNYRVLLSAQVSEKGVVQLNAVVFEQGSDNVIDYQKSEKLAAYYEKLIKRKLHIRPGP